MNGSKTELEYKYFYFFNFISEYNSFFALTPNHSLVYFCRKSLQ